MVNTVDHVIPAWSDTLYSDPAEYNQAMMAWFANVLIINVWCKFLFWIIVLHDQRCANFLIVGIE